jgi:hypothetical protein
MANRHVWNSFYGEFVLNLALGLTPSQRWQKEVQSLYTHVQERSKQTGFFNRGDKAMVSIMPPLQMKQLQRKPEIDAPFNQPINEDANSTLTTVFQRNQQLTNK